MSSALISPLQQRIIEHIRHEGPLLFADYMRMALYEPGHGYYVTGQAKMGWEGDYYTSTDVSPLFAHCMGRQLYQLWESLGQPGTFTVLEQGAGRGDLSRGITFWAIREAPAFARALDYHTSDIATGQDALPSTFSSDSASRLNQVSLAPMVILSNELVDAFPVHIVEKRGDQLYELYIAEQEGRLYEVLSHPGSEAVSCYLDTYKIPWRSFEDGWRAEINLDALRWMERTASLLPASKTKRKPQGFFLTIDYGDKARQLYIRERHSGTLTCYYNHQLSDRPLALPGEQDLTAHVNFSALIQEGRRHGLRLQQFTTQREWLTEMGIYEELERIRQRDFSVLDSELASDAGQVALLRWYDLRQRVSALTSRSGMGNFKVLIMKR